MEEAEQEMEEELISQEESMDEKEHRKVTGGREKASDAYLDFIQTAITFNKGGSWHRIKAPDRDINGKRYDCGDNCFLNLHGISSDFPPFYSVQSAAGLIIANGNVGQYLSHYEEDISTYLSIDGGLNWFEVNFIKKGSKRLTYL